MTTTENKITDLTQLESGSYYKINGTKKYCIGTERSG